MLYPRTTITKQLQLPIYAYCFYHVITVEFGYQNKVVYEVDYISLPAVFAGLNPTPTSTPTVQSPTTGKCIHFS